MRIVVEKIPEEGQEITLDDAADWATRAANDAMDGSIQGMIGHLHLQVRHEMLYVSGELCPQGTVSCHRCGQSVELSQALSVDLRYIAAKHKPEGSFELSTSELDLGWYDKGMLQLADVVSEVIALSIPMKILCEDAKACDQRYKAFESKDGQEASASHLGFRALKNWTR